MLALSAFGQYSLETAGAPPAEIAPEMAAELQQEGYKVLGGDGSVFAELWFRNSSVETSDSGEFEVTWNTVTHGTLIGVIHFPADAVDRRGMAIPAGVYTMRFSFYPADGAHQGVEPSRDFLILSKAADDKDPKATPGFEDLMKKSYEASGVPHPIVLAMWKPDSGWEAGLVKLGEHDWVLSVKVGETGISVIVAGINEHG